ncbi:hypothetical protein ACLS0F_05500 [Avibacterium endocarditidis]|uniref:RiboL-PSP-HEPN domain-containing protein n=1 Tax=Avibacterium endocarditidis TaxID=380674 RepID=A0ABX4ZQZ0_9PAST|nr:hypothetical protein [Avibacterium endocarditidis]POY41620.1 hypothetical protein C3Z13_11025 [Avibacterium endocarditidis]
MNCIKDNNYFTRIDKMYKEYQKNISDIDIHIIKLPFLVSLKQDYIDVFRKVFVISVANSFERHLLECLPKIFSSNNNILYNFINCQALSRKYHTLFSWEKNNCNSFYMLFGENFCNCMKEKINKFSKLKNGERSFLSLGKERNIVVHKGVKFSDYDRDIEEIYRDYKEALHYYSFLIMKIDEFHKKDVNNII